MLARLSHFVQAVDGHNQQQLKSSQETCGFVLYRLGEAILTAKAQICKTGAVKCKTRLITEAVRLSERRTLCSSLKVKTPPRPAVLASRFANCYMSSTENPSALLLLSLGSVKSVNPPSSFVRDLRITLGLAREAWMGSLVLEILTRCLTH